MLKSALPRIAQIFAEETQTTHGYTSIAYSVAQHFDKREQVSANRWHLEVRLESPGQVDRELIAWLRKAYELAG